MSLRVCVEPLVSRGQLLAGVDGLDDGQAWLSGLQAGVGEGSSPPPEALPPRLSLAPTPCFSGPRRPPTRPSHPAPAPSPGLGKRLLSLVREGRGWPQGWRPSSHPLPFDRSGTVWSPSRGCWALSVVGSLLGVFVSCDGRTVSDGRGCVGSEASLLPVPAQPGGSRAGLRGGVPSPGETSLGPRRHRPCLPTPFPAGGERWKGVHLEDQLISRLTGFPSKRPARMGQG